MRRIESAAAPPADVAVLTRNLELWPVLREVVEGYSVLELETIKTPLNLRDVMRVLRHVVVDKASLGYASMAARLHRSGVKVLLAVDQTAEVVEELGRLLPDLRQVVIAHGSVRAENLAHHRIRRREQRILCVGKLRRRPLRLGKPRIGSVHAGRFNAQCGILSIQAAHHTGGEPLAPLHFSVLRSR